MGPSRAFLLPVLFLVACGKQPHPTASNETPEVAVQTVKTEPIDLTITLVGRCIANQTVEIRSRVTGTLLERPFSEGALVKEGDVLFQIDPAEFAAKLETAQARQAQADAKLEQSQRDVARVKPLAEAGAAPVQELEHVQTILLAAQADVRYSRATVDQAKLELSYCTIVAPFSGRVGKATRDIGATIGPADGKLLDLDEVDPIAVEFAISEREYMALRRDIDSGKIIPPRPEALQVRVKLLDGETYPEVGMIAFRDVRVQAETGTARARATLKNQAGKLVPGQFARVLIIGMKRPAAILLPQRAVMLGPAGASVWVVNEQSIVEARAVTAGEWTDQRWLIDDGLKPGDRVVVDSTQRLRGGLTVKPVEQQPGAKPPAEQPTAALETSAP